MRLDEKVPFAQLLATLGTLYDRPLSEPMVAMYWEAMRAFSLSAIHSAARQHIQDPNQGRFMPKPADLIGPIQGDRAGQALHAWGALQKAICQHGHYCSVRCSDALIHAVIEHMGGWIALSLCSLKDAQYQRHVFERLYQHYLSHPPLSIPAQLSGVFRDEPPVFIDTGALHTLLQHSKAPDTLPTTQERSR